MPQDQKKKMTLEEFQETETPGLLAIYDFIHEMLLDDALAATRSFLDSSYSKGLRKVRIITGKGIHSKNGEAVLRPAVTEVCKNHPKVREVTVPKAVEGGSGALTVIFKAK